MKIGKQKSTLSTTDIQKNILPILWKYPIKSASIFGSFARQEARPDIDILFEFASTICFYNWLISIRKHSTRIGR
jgi:predicted nucleotidyltransferase